MRLNEAAHTTDPLAPETSENGGDSSPAPAAPGSGARRRRACARCVAAVLFERKRHHPERELAPRCLG